MTRHAVAFAIMFSVSSAQAEPAGDPPVPPPAPVEYQPPPGAESGRIDELSDGESAGRTVGRTLLYIPRGVVELVFLPFRGAIWADENYHIVAAARRWFFNDDMTFGVFPLVAFESAQGVMVGAQLITGASPNDIFRVFGGIGTASRYRVSGQYLMTNRFDGRLNAQVDVEYDQRGKSRFYGFGNANQVEVRRPMPIDPFDEDVAVLAFYKDKLARASAIASYQLFRNFFVDGGGNIARRARDDSSEGPPIQDVYIPQTLIAFDHYDSLYVEGELSYDSRGPASDWQPRMLWSSGTLASVYGGLVALDTDRNFFRYGADVQQLFPIGANPRVISVRLQTEAITAEVDEVPFNEVPALGGRQWLRGYATDRFRDKIAAVGSIEYQWDLARWLYASLYVDVGRVYPSWSDVTLDNMRCGYGFALEAQTHRSMLGRVSVSSSIDGDVWFNLYLDPVSDIQPRVRRR